MGLSILFDDMKLDYFRFAKKFFLLLLYNGSNSTQLSLTSLKTNLLDGIVTAVISACIKKKNLSTLVNFCVAILILKMEEKSIFGILCFIKKGKNATETQKKICTLYGEGAVTEQKC